MPASILIVDDDATLRKVLRTTLEPLGEILEARGGRQALRLIATKRPKLVMLDVAMPEMDGLEVLRAARELDASLTIVMLTGSTDLELARRALEDGARAYITKPFEAAALRNEVQRLLDSSGNDDGRPWRVLS